PAGKSIGNKVDLNVPSRIGRAVPQMVFSPDGKLFAVYRKTEAEVFDVATHKSLQRIPSYQMTVIGLAFQPALGNRKVMLPRVDSSTGKGQLWNVNDKKRETFFYASADEDRPSFGPGLAFRSDGKILASLGSNSISLWDFSGDAPIASIPVEGYALAFQPDS